MVNPVVFMLVALLTVIIVYLLVLGLVLYKAGDHANRTVDPDARHQNKILFWIIVALLFDKLAIVLGLFVFLLITALGVSTTAALF